MPEQLGLKLGDVLVTGGHGFIGRHVVTALARAGANPVSISQRSGSTLSDLPGETVTVDLEDVRGVSDVIRGVDSVIHLAARAGGIQFQQEGGGDVFSSNRLITDNLLAACADAKRQTHLSRVLAGDVPGIIGDRSPNPTPSSALPIGPIHMPGPRSPTR